MNQMNSLGDYFIYFSIFIIVSAGESPNEKYIYQLIFFLQNDDRMKKFFFNMLK